MNQPKDIIFWSNGNTTAFDKYGNQISELQHGWFTAQLESLERAGVDPLSVRFVLPNERRALPSRTSEGHWNWSIEP